MVSQKKDPTLMIVGIILAIAVIGWIVASSMMPSQSVNPSLKVTKFTSTGKALGESPCCKNTGQSLSGSEGRGIQGCAGQKGGCNKAGSGGCQSQKGDCQKTCASGQGSAGKRF